MEAIPPLLTPVTFQQSAGVRQGSERTQRTSARLTRARPHRAESVALSGQSIRRGGGLQGSGEVSAAELRTLLVDTERRTLLLRTHDDNDLLWRLAGDHFRLLPSVGTGHERLIVSPDARVLLLRPRYERGRAPDSLWVDVESGQTRRFSRRNDPMAWSARGTVADVYGRRGLRTWSDPTPDEIGLFLRWLDDATDAKVDPTLIR